MIPVRMNETILETKNITQHFRGVTALKKVNFSVFRGEIHGLVGENGAGKSTLVKILSGLLKPSEGQIIIEGKEIRDINPQNSNSLYGISIVPQHIEFFPYLTIAENLYIDNLPKRNGLIDYKRLNQEALSWIKKFELDLDPTTIMEKLSFVQQKVVLILKALKNQSKIIILDEPTASLHVDEIEHLFKFIKDFNNQGVTFIYISHHLEEIFKICDRVTVLRDGQIQAVEKVNELDLKKLVHLMVGQEIKNLFKEKKKSSAKTVLKIHDLYGEKILQGINFELREGEILGILSNRGGGKDELVRILFGLGRYRRGGIDYLGQKINIYSPSDMLLKGVYLLPDDRHRDGLFLDKPVKDNISICALHKALNKFGFIQNKSEENIAHSFIQKFSISTPSALQEVQFLSGGNQQKVLFSKIMNADPKVLVLDSPTVGVDIKARMEIHQIIKNISLQGISILLITSDLDEILTLTDRILILVKGKITHEVFTHDPHFNRKDLGFLMEGGELHE